jgi:hypothetical protein
MNLPLVVNGDEDQNRAWRPDVSGAAGIRWHSTRMRLQLVQQMEVMVDSGEPGLDVSRAASVIDDPLA